MAGVQQDEHYKRFQKGGIVPFNREVISREKCDPKRLRRWEISKLDMIKEISISSNDSHTGTIVQSEEYIRDAGPSSRGAELPTQVEMNTNGNSMSFAELLLGTLKQKNQVER